MSRRRCARRIPGRYDWQAAPAVRPQRLGDARRSPAPRAHAHGRGAADALRPGCQCRVLILDSVSRSFGAGVHRRSVLDRVSVSIAAATETAIIGRSGCGKSTLLNLISGIDRPDSGRVIFDGVDLGALRGTGSARVFRRRKVGFVYQFFNLLPTLDVEENVRLVLSLDGVGAARGAPSQPRDAAARGTGRSAAVRRWMCSPAVSSSAWRWRAPWCTSRRCCWPMSPPAISMKSRPRSSRRCCGSWRASAVPPWCW